MISVQKQQEINDASSNVIATENEDILVRIVYKSCCRKNKKI